MPRSEIYFYYRGYQVSYYYNMSGHNKWTQIKRKKEATDQKRAAVFSKLLRAISVAVQQEPNPQFNPTLRCAIDKAKEYNVPLENIERAIHKSSDTKNFSQLTMEAYGPEGTALLIFSVTDNKNRTVSEIKKILSDHEGKWADPGSVTWAFEVDGGVWRAKFPQPISLGAQEKLLSLVDALDDHNDITELYTNADLPTE